MSLRDRKKEMTRRQLRAAALRLFRERGFEETRVQDIADAVPVSLTTFFNYFGTKDAILDEIVLELLDGYRNELEGLRRSASSPVSEAIRTVIGRIAREVERDREFYLLVYEHSSLFHATGKVRERELVVWDAFASLFRDGQRRGEIRRDVDPLQLAEVLTGIVHLVTLNWLTAWWKDRGDLKQRLSTALDVFLRGCEPERPGDS